MTLLSIVQDVCAELSLVQPPAVANSQDNQVVQLMALVNRAGRDLADVYAWQALRKEFNFDTVAAEAQPPVAIPADYDRWVDNSFFNRSTRRPMNGPLTPRQWQWIKAQPAYASVYLAWVERGNTFLIQPPPPAGQSIYGEYLTNCWAQSAGGTPQPQFDADTDTTLLSENLIGLGTIWRWLSRKGLDYAEALSDYERTLERAMARDGGATAMSLSPQPIDPNRVNLPDGNFGG